MMKGPQFSRLKANEECQNANEINVYFSRFSSTNPEPILGPSCIDDRFAIVSELAALSQVHMRLTDNDRQRYFLVPIQKNQYRFFVADRRIVAFISWAFLSPASETAFAISKRQLECADWDSGNRLWFVDFIAPFGHAKNILFQLRRAGWPIGVARAKREKRGLLRLACFRKCQANALAAFDRTMADVIPVNDANG